LLWQLEELVGESGDEQLDAADTTPDGRRQRLLKRVRDDMFEITDELSESTIVTQTLERVATGTASFREQRGPGSVSGGDVMVEPLEESGPSTTTTTTVTRATSVCDPEDESDWIEVDNLLDEEENQGNFTALPRPDSTERIQLVLRTMTNKLLQRKRTVRRVQGVGLGINITPIGSSSPPRSRSWTPVPDRERQPESGASTPGRSAVATTSSTGQSTPSPAANASSPPSSSSLPLKGKGRRRPPPLGEGSRRPSSSFVGAAGNALRSAMRPMTSKTNLGQREEVHEEAGAPDTSSSTPRPPPPTPFPAAPTPASFSHNRTVSVSESVRTRSNRIHTSSSQIFSPHAEVAEDLFPHEGLIRNIHRFCRYASAAYGQNFLRILGMGNADLHFPTTGRHHANSWAFAQHTNIPIDALLLSSYSEVSPTIATDKAPPLVHYIAVEHHLKAIVLTCRGTLGLSDVLVDLTCAYREITVEGGDPHGSYHVHSGMYNSALKLTEKCSRVHQTLVEALEKYPDYGLVLSGHSLGGGVAALLAITCSVKASVFRAQNAARATPVSHPPISTPFVTSFSSGLPPGRPIHCYAYGIPAVSSIDLAKYSVGLITSVVQNADVVPTLSLGVLRDLKNIAVTLHEESGVAEEIVVRAMGLGKPFPEHHRAPNDGRVPSDEQVLADWMMSLIKTMRADMDNHKLFPPGAVYIMVSFVAQIATKLTSAGVLRCQRPGRGRARRKWHGRVPQAGTAHHPASVRVGRGTVPRA
jgi:hypothetical protein